MDKILIVDDSPTVRKFLIHTLKPRGYRCIEASDGFDALERLSAHPDLNLMITDLNMPNMDGIELISNIRENPQTADLPVIMLTSEADQQNRTLARQAGANLYLTKPSPAHIILFKVRSLLEADN